MSPQSHVFEKKNENPTWPCKPKSADELDKLIGDLDSCRSALEYLCPVTLEEVPWTELCSLLILGAGAYCFDELKKADFDSKIYINHDGSWLLLFADEEEDIQPYLDRCSQKLQSLTVNNSDMTTLSVHRLKSLKKLRLFDCSSLTTLPGLALLTGLTHLSLYKCRNLTALPGLEWLTGLTELNLFGCESLTELPGLVWHTRLKYLDLSYCRKLIALPGLEQFTGLTYLNLYECRSLFALWGLEQLTGLTYLNLFGCRRLTALRGLEQLTGLTYLNLSGCENLTALPGLEQLTVLTSLNLHKCEKLTDLRGLEHLTRLTSLNLSYCRSLTDLPGLEQLTALTELDLSYCRSLTDLPKLGQLNKLTALTLSDCSSLTELPGLEQLTGLTKLYLYGCSSLTALTGLEYLTELTELNLVGCTNLTDLPYLGNLVSLRRLDLRGLHLKELPEGLPKIAELFTRDFFNKDNGTTGAVVNLFGTTIDGVDMSIFEQPHEMVLEWLRTQMEGTSRTLNEIKVVFLGDGEAGKSHTIARLMGDGGEPVGYMDQSTPGIVIKDKDYEQDGRKFRVHYWDFGGQEIMHSMHRIFLTNRTMYVVLLNAREDKQGEQAQYWLHNVQSFAPGAPVVLVLNKIDQNPKASVDETTLRARYPGLKTIVRLSARDFDREQFNREFTDRLLSEIADSGYLDAQWPQSWIAVKNQLENMKPHYILGTAYREICKNCKVEGVEEELLHWFNDLGVSFCFCDKEDYTLNKHVILRPDWITNALYILLFNECAGTKNGQLPHKGIYALLERAHEDKTISCTLPGARYDTPGDIAYVLGVMRKFQLSLDTGDGREFIPMLCQQDSTVDIHYHEKDAETLEFSMEFEYLPDNLLHRLMVERHAELELDSVWRKGARFSLKELGLSAVVVIDGCALRFFVQHKDPMHRPNTYLAMLKANVDRIVKRMGIKAPECKLIYKLDGKRDEFDYEELRMLREIGQGSALAKSHRKMIPIEDILNQSAPENMEDEKKLLEAIRRSCLNIQGDMRYRGSEEDDRNTRIRDDLRYIGYTVHDQTRCGITESGKRAGELDLEIRRENNEPWTIVESLRIRSGAKADWNKHLHKLVDRYNAHGLRSLFLIAFADCDEESFLKIWKGYKEEHIQGHNAGKFTYVEGSFREIPEASAQLIKIAQCRYDCGGSRYTVYHIFLQMEPK